MAKNKIVLFMIIFLTGCTGNISETGIAEVEKNSIVLDVEKAEEINVIEVEDYSGLTKKQISQIEQLKEIGRKMYKINQYDKSIEAYLKILEIDNDNFEANYRLGNNYQVLKKYEEAIKYFKKAIVIRKDLAYIINALLAFSYHNLGDTEKAFIYHKKAIKQNPDYFYGYEYLRVYNEKKWKIKEIEKFELEQIERFYRFYEKPENYNLIQLFDDTWKFGFGNITVAHKYESLGFMYLENDNQDFTQSAYYFKKAFETQPYINALYLLGLSYFYDEKYDEAKEIFLNLNKSVPTHLKSYMYLLEIYNKNNNIEEGKILIMSYKNMLDFYEENGYWNPKSFFAQSNFINKDSKKYYQGKYDFYKNIFK